MKHLQDGSVSANLESAHATYSHVRLLLLCEINTLCVMVFSQHVTSPLKWRELGQKVASWKIPGADMNFKAFL